MEMQASQIAEVFILVIINLKSRALNAVKAIRRGYICCRIWDGTQNLKQNCLINIVTENNLLS